MRSHVCIIIVMFCWMAFACKKEHTEQQPPVQPPPEQPAPDSASAADEREGFKQMTVYTTQRIVKWQSPVSVFVADTSFTYLTSQVDSVISQVNALLGTSLSIKRVSTREGSSIQVYFTDEDTYLKAEPAVAAQNLIFTGFGYAAWDNTWTIYHASVFVDTTAMAGDSLHQRLIVYHEFMHTLGFQGHVSVQTLSSVMFSYANAPYLPGYTEYDKKMIRWLYNPSVKAGMNETELDTVIDSL